MQYDTDCSQQRRINRYNKHHETDRDYIMINDLFNYILLFNNCKQNAESLITNNSMRNIQRMLR